MKQQQELIPMTTGEYLKQRRIERKLSLAAVAQAIHLDEKLLEDVEQEQVNQIALVYRNGYIKTYARYLRIPEEVIQALVSPADIKEPAMRNIFSEPPKRNPMEKWLRATSYVLASLLIGTLAWQFTHEAVRLSQNGARLRTEGQPAEVSESTKDQGKKQGLTEPVNASIATLGALHDNPAESWDTAGSVSTTISHPPLPEGESRLQISVSADSWVEIIDANGQELEMDLLRGGSDKAYRGKPPFRIMLGRASAVRLSMDGDPLDLAAYTRDDVVQLSWPQKMQTENSGPDAN